MENTGSIKRKIVAKDLLLERANCNFDKSELQQLFHGDPEYLEKFLDLCKDVEENPKL